MPNRTGIMRNYVADNDLNLLLLLPFHIPKLSPIKTDE